MATDKPQPATADIDLIVATVGREKELSLFLASVRDQAPVRARVIIVDQNHDDRIVFVLEQEPGSPEVVRLNASGGVSQARSSGLTLATAPIVAWPDDDCSYPPGLLPYVVVAFDSDPKLDVLVGRIEDPSGDVGLLAVPTRGIILDSRSLWRYPSAPTFFARRRAAERVGDWSTSFGPGGNSSWDAGEDTDWLIRAVREGLRVRFDPAVTVLHKNPFTRGSTEARKRARRYGQCTSAVALTHGYGLRFVAWLVVRAAGGAAISFATGRFSRAAIHFEAAIGRVQGVVLFRHRQRRDGATGTRGDTFPRARRRRRS